MEWISVASIQPPAYGEKSAENNNRIMERGFSLLEEALKKGTAFCCLPEFFNVFGAGEGDMMAASSNHKDVLGRARDLARRYDSFVILPMLVREQERFYNRACVIDARGDVPGCYDKVHPTLGEKEKLQIEPGSKLKTFDTKHGRIAIAICYDVYFPEFFSALTLLKPDIIFFPSLQRSDHEMASEAMLKVRAMDTKAYLVRSSFGCEINAPWKPGMVFGQSCIVHPDGTVLANAGHYEGFAMARIKVPFDWQRQRCSGYPPMPVREFLDVDRRPDVYRI